MSRILNDTAKLNPAAAKMEKQQLPEPPTAAESSIPGALASLAFYAGFLPGKIFRNFPILGRSWRLEGRTPIPAICEAITEVWISFIEFEVALNPGNLSFDDPARLSLFFGERDTPSLPERARSPTDVATADISSESAVAANNLIDLFNNLVKHYHWEDVVCLPPNWDSCPWSFVGPPPIPIKMLTDFKEAAYSLGYSLNRKDAKLTMAELLEVGGRQQKKPTESTTTTKHRTHKIDGGDSRKNESNKSLPNSLEEREKQTPQIDECSDDWASNKTVATMLSIKTRTLATRRSGGERLDIGNDRFGIDDHDCIWRKAGNEHPRYYLRGGHLRKIVDQLAESTDNFDKNRH